MIVITQDDKEFDTVELAKIKRQVDNSSEKVVELKIGITKQHEIFIGLDEKTRLIYCGKYSSAEEAEYFADCLVANQQLLRPVFKFPPYGKLIEWEKLKE